jgi:phosphopantothenate---cysteine ligase (CTP)
MNVLVTAGNTQVSIDRVRVITNVFRGRTGARIAGCLARAGHQVCLLTSFPESAPADAEVDLASGNRLEIKPYRTFDDLHREMSQALRLGAGVDVLVHSAAVSDYLVGGIYVATTDGRMQDVSAGKVKSDEPELWLRLVRAPKLIDLVRGEWGFTGVVVKFKLEVNVSEKRLIEIAEHSRLHSGADLMVANTLDETGVCAFLGPASSGGYRRIPRGQLAEAVRQAVEEVASARPRAMCLS